MIIDSLTGLERYFSLNPHFEKVYKFLRSQPIDELADGRYDIDGDNAYMTVSTHEGKNPEEVLLEVHDSYIDIQLPLEGIETFGWRDRMYCEEIAQPYNEAEDITCFAEEAAAFFTVAPPNLVIFFPTDAHAPLIGNGTLKKIVVKVKC
jgi:YhcH/YjgK/YiaL family protein